MSYPEYVSCVFELCQDGDGKPSHIFLTFVSGADYFSRKQIGSLFLTFKKDVTWDEATELETAMNRNLRGLGIRHLAGGEP